jgi:retron-type reverse transcriptase
MDLSKFFDNVDHGILMHRVALKIRDKRVLRLIGKYLRAGLRVKELTGRSGFVSMAYRYKKRSQYVRGWMNHKVFAFIIFS